MLTLNIYNRRGQVWSLDLLVAAMIFVSGLVLIYFFAFNYNSSTFDDLGELYYEADLVSNVLLSEDEEGILTQGKVNQSKLDSFDSLSDQDKRSHVGVLRNFYFSIPGMAVNGNPQEFVGILNTTPVSDQIRVTRIVVYQNTITRMEVVSWK